MKLSQLSTGRTLDVLCEITPYIANITTDKAILDVFSQKLDVSELTVMSAKIISVTRYNKMLSILLNDHRSDVYGILSALNEKTPEEIAAQPLTDTMGQLREVLQDEDLLAFFKSSVPQGQTVPSAPSAPSPG